MMELEPSRQLRSSTRDNRHPVKVNLNFFTRLYDRLYVAPANTTARPPVAKKKLSATSEDEHCFYIPSPWPSPFPFKLMY